MTSARLTMRMCSVKCKGPDDLDDYDFGDDDEDDEEEYVIEDDQPDDTDEA